MKHTLFTLFGAGALATIAFDAFGQGLSPLFGYAKLVPVGLANSTLKQVFGSSPAGAAYLLHTVTGVVFCVLGYLLIARPFSARSFPICTGA